MQSWVETKSIGGRLLAILPVCTPDGILKYPRFGWGLTCPLLKAELEHDEDSGKTTVSNVDIKAKLRDAEWATMAELFADDEGDDGPRWRAFIEWLGRTSMCGSPNPTRRPFPERYLPSGVLSRRSGELASLRDEEIVVPEVELARKPSKAKTRAAGVE